MTTIDRRHRGRAIRKSRRISGPDTRVRFVTIRADFSGLQRALEDATRRFGRLLVAVNHRPQIIHNGRKPR